MPHARRSLVAAPGCIRVSPKIFTTRKAERRVDQFAAAHSSNAERKKSAHGIRAAAHSLFLQNKSACARPTRSSTAPRFVAFPCKRCAKKSARGARTRHSAAPSMCVFVCLCVCVSVCLDVCVRVCTTLSVGRVSVSSCRRGGARDDARTRAWSTHEQIESGSAARVRATPFTT